MISHEVINVMILPMLDRILVRMNAKSGAFAVVWFMYN